VATSSQGAGGERPNRTAFATAYARAYHQVADDPRILTDPVVACLAGVTTDELSAVAEPTDDRPGSGAIYRPRRLFFAARARFAEDRVRAAHAVGVRQVVILGAGLDTFAYRNPFPAVQVFEVDHPDTQAWKRRRLAEAAISVPETVSFVPVDFETDTLATALGATGFIRADPAVFVWLGVIYYLTTDAVMHTLEYIAGQGAPTEVIFDYLQPGDTEGERAQLRVRERNAAAAGEPWFSYFTPADITARLGALGFTDIDDRSAAQLIDGYLDGPGEFENDTPYALRASRVLRACR
jgi:methyltransferase (TIGR00027 family)